MLVPRLPIVFGAQEYPVLSSSLLHTEVTLPVNDDGNGEKAPVAVKAERRRVRLMIDFILCINIDLNVAKNCGEINIWMLMDLGIQYQLSEALGMK